MKKIFLYLILIMINFCESEKTKNKVVEETKLETRCINGKEYLVSDYGFSKLTQPDGVHKKCK